MKDLTQLPQLQATLNNLYDNATLRSAGISPEQANEITLRVPYLSPCCVAKIQDGYCSECWCEVEGGI